MKKSKFSEQQIAFMLRQRDGGDKRAVASADAIEMRVFSQPLTYQ